MFEDVSLLLLGVTDISLFTELFPLPEVLSVAAPPQSDVAPESQTACCDTFVLAILSSSLSNETSADNRSERCCCVMPE